MNPLLALPSDSSFARITSSSWVELRGVDAGTHLHRFCTQDLKNVSVGEAREAMFLDVKGKLVAFGEVFRGESSWWFSGLGDQATRLAPHLDRYVVREDVQVVDRSSELGRVLLKFNSALAAQTWSREMGAASDVFPIGGWELNPLWRLEWNRTWGDAIRWVVGPIDEINPWIDQQRSAKSPESPAELSSNLVDAIRIAAGYPLFGIDIDSSNLPQELARDQRAISFTKGCYLGQETVARIDALGHVNRLLVQVAGSGAIPETPAELKLSGDVVGRLTSVAFTGNDAAAWQGMATVKRVRSAVGTVLQLSDQSECRVCGTTNTI